MMTALDRKLVRDLWHLKGQIIAVALVVACGIATYVTMRSAHRALLSSQQLYYRQSRFAEVFASARRAPRTVLAKLRAIPGVMTVEDRVVFDVTVDVPGLDEPAALRLVSIPENSQPRLNEVTLTRGRWIEPNRPDQIVLSQAFAAANGLEPGDSFGAVMNGRWRELRIAGLGLSPEYIYEIRPGDIFPDRRRFGVAWMSREAMEAAFDMEGGFNDITIQLSGGASEAEVISRIDTILAAYGGTGAYGRHEQISHRFLSDEISGLEVNATILPTIFLGVAAFLIHLVLSRLVQTQRDQIAVLKAFGYSSTRVGLHYLEFSLTAVLAGTAIGTAAGAWLGSSLTRLYTDFFNFPLLRYDLPLSLVAEAAGISAAAATIGALVSVRDAIALPPAEAMRPEAPPRFHAGWIERAGLQRIISPSGRIVVRNIARRRMKSFLSILGIAMAVSILIVGRYSFDAVEYLMEFQFENVQREDVTVSFFLPRPWETVYALQRMDGVLSVEPFRAVPVRLRHGHRSRRAALTGIFPGGELRRMIDAEGAVFDVPPEGLVMTTKLAEILGVEPGDELIVEVLEESRPVRRVELVRTVDELIGTAAYINARSLHRMLGQGRTISGAYMLVDPAHSNELYEELKTMPVVAGVGIREAMLRGFQETIAKSLSISNYAVIFFASIIAIGVVYNGARIGLSERGRELASLRVLGFTRHEVGAMLVGEQVILTALAIPVGFAIGFFFVVLISNAFDTELYRFPVVLTAKSFGFAFLIVVIASALSSLIVLRRIATLDLIAVLKTRE